MLDKNSTEDGKAAWSTQRKEYLKKVKAFKNTSLIQEKEILITSDFLLKYII